MVIVQSIHETRPLLADEFHPGTFTPRTPAIEDAFAWGQELHAGQKRLSGEPYFLTHCAWVGGFIDNLVGNEAWTIAALLHDAVEDKGATLDDVRQRFPGPLGQEVAHIVDGVTKMSVPKDGRSREMETLRKIAMSRDPAVYLVKLADKSHNLLTLQYMTQAKAAQKAAEAVRAYGKLAGILNCHKWRCWIEDLAFPYMDPDHFAVVRKAIDSDPRMQPEFISSMLNQLGGLMEKAGISGEVSILVNGYWQIWQKLRRMARNRKAPLSGYAHVNDVISFRMIIDTEDRDQCYRLLGAVHAFYGRYLDNDRFDDFIAYPQNRYRALQSTIWLPGLGAVEIAITTREMEGENMWGVVHLLRTDNREMLRYYSPVEIFTPTGGARFLAEGSTVLDAVASIQQEFLLDRISAVQVNGVMARLSDRVAAGDIVEVVTSGKRLVPSENWMGFANESTARLLRSVLATKALRSAAERGRLLISPVLGEHGIVSLEDIQALKPDLLETLLEKLGSPSLEDLYTAVGGGAVALDELGDLLREVGISRQALGWTTINIEAKQDWNKPGVMLTLARLVFQFSGNIQRSVNNTLPDGGFMMRIVAEFPETTDLDRLYRAFASCGLEFRSLEIV